MSRLHIISIDENCKWDKIVKSFTKHDIYYLSGYVKAFQIHGDGQPILFFYQDENIKALNVVMKRDIAEDKIFSKKIPSGTYFDIATPYGYGGFLIEGNITEEGLKKLDNDYSCFCKKQGIICEFVRFHPIIYNSEYLNNFYNVFKLGKTITINLDSEEEIRANLSSKNRNVIRKALRSGVEIFWGRDPKLFKEFINLYNATMERNNAKKYYYFDNKFYESILYDLKYNTQIFYALYKDRIIAMAMILFCNQQMHYHLSASNREYQHLAPTNLLLYEAACWGYQNGYKSFHLGGGLGSKEDDLYKFKKAFNRNFENSFYIGKKIFDEDKYNELVDIRRKEENFIINDILFFPAYRAN